MRLSVSRSVLVFCISTALVCLSACGRPASDEASIAAVEATVRAYNEALIRAFSSFDMNELNATATEDQAWTEFYLMAALGEGGVQMKATMVSIDFGEVTFSEDGAASVTTTEVWDYEHISLETSETVRTEQNVTYHLRYDLVEQDGRWLVNAVTSLDESTATDDTVR
jgi:hypothetical protein